MEVGDGAQRWMKAYEVDDEKWWEMKVNEGELRQ